MLVNQVGSGPSFLDCPWWARRTRHRPGRGTLGCSLPGSGSQSLGFSPCGAWVPFRAPRGGRTGCWLTVWERVYEDGPANARGRGPGMGPQPTGCSALLSKKRPSPVDSRSRLRLACVWLVRGATSCRPLPPWNPHLRRLGGRRGPPTIHQAVLSPDRPTPRPARRLPPDRASMASTPAPPAAPRCSAAWA
jgi:hypothetical protein